MASRLKSLELQGYKTFASRILFEFPGRITAIVGPNGSGKSNIADAIRWVLGEQSFSLLRARKTEDMIFSGSEHRPRAGMALASIVFDNEDQWLPLEFSEISITRRAYRDGQNEYLLNGQRVRLKEITELLSRAGLSERTYTIIGQGLIDAALSLRPEERRRFFEEAAGVGLYRIRREEALNRLDATRRNLERVQDILVELEPRVKSLERQAQRAQEYERISADLKLLLREWYGYHWFQSQQRVVQSRETVRKIEQRLAEQRARTEEQENRLKEIREAWTEVGSQIEALKERALRLEREKTQLERSAAVLEERRAALLTQQQSIVTDRERLEAERTEIQVQILALQREHEQVQAELGAAQREIRALSQQLESRESEERALIVQKNSLQVTLSGLAKRQYAYEVEYESYKRRLSDLQDQIKRATQQKGEHLQVLEDVKERLAQRRQGVEALETRVRELSTELGALLQHLEAAREALRGFQKEQDAVEAAILKARAELSVLEQAEATFDGLSQGTQTLLRAIQDGRLPGRVQRLSQILSIAPDYERAIAAALGERIEGLVLEDPESAEAVLAFLEGHEKGRVILLLGRKKTSGLKATFPNDEACLGRAIDFVQVGTINQEVLQTLLENTWIVRHRRDASHLWDALPAGGRLVTLQGEVFTADGMIIAGLDQRAMLISRSRRQRELQATLQRLEQKMASFGQSRAVREAELARLENERVAVERELKRLRGELEQRRREYEGFVGRMRRQEEDLQRAEETLRQTEAQRAVIEQQMQALEQSAQTAQMEIKELQTQLEQVNVAIQALAVGTLKDQINHWRSVERMATQRLNHLSQRLSDYQQALQRTTSRLNELEARMLQTQSALVALEQEAEGLQLRLNEFERMEVELREQWVPLEAEYRRLQTEQERVTAEWRAQQQQLAFLEKQAQQAQLEHAREEEALASLQRRIEEDLGLVSFTYIETVAGQEPLPLNGMVEALPALQQLPPDIEESIARYRSQLKRIGHISPDLLKEYQELKTRYDYLRGQMEDLKKAESDVREIIAELDGLIREAFMRTFKAVAREFQQNFVRLFGGGEARLYLEDESQPGESGIEIEVRLPGRREQGLALLSGGERSLTSVALVFSLLKVSPPPFCILDEVDAMLDEANVGRFCDLLKELSQETQFIVITHNRNTVQTADVIYGVTMGKDMTSQVISLRLENLAEVLV
ncbi:chromosome segregation protein SMC [uncultured Thermanaerothrix sp.]|uniref:chromosome segregation protein SMC n=1 Tax=uncultured Thermanaerothrix sp. TaxID=1195149 RepID=UPI002613889E|nr:chromosome segregation protein SMC [uncultured Thermanaerothrix sp.]